MFAVLWSETTWAGFLGDPNYLAFDDYKRQDTVFKFGMQGWFLWGTAAATGAYLTLRRWPLLLRVAFVPFLLVMGISSLVDMQGRTRGTDPKTGTQWESFDNTRRQNWDAWAHMMPPEQEAATWLQSQTGPNENILEAEQKEGGDYSVYTRYAHATGIATIIGPQSHSFQWSPNQNRVTRLPDETGQDFFGRKIDAQWKEVYKRKDEARTAFTTDNASERREILKRYNVRYVIWGQLEREQYGEEAHTRLNRDLKLVKRFGFEPNDDPEHRVEIFEVP
ncbi:hypothetical protein EON80_25430 [bacterium]|nr:MAG: hypothetical protein EON80_25430 [bacterium]